MGLTCFKFKNNKRLESAAQNNPPMRVGEIGLAVQLLQEGLIFLKYPLPRSTRKDGSMDGVYGLETKGAIQAFQRKYLLRDDGSAGEKTLKRMDICLPFYLPGEEPVDPSKIKFTHECRLHLRYTRTAAFLDEMPVWPGIYIRKQFEQAQKIYAQYGIRLILASSELLELPALAELLLLLVETDCDNRRDLGSDLRLLQSSGSVVPANEIVGYFVYRMAGTEYQNLLDGCAAHLPNRPAFAIAMSGFSPYNTLAHELGHVLVGLSYVPPHHPDRNNLMVEGGSNEPTPVLDERQLAQIRRNPLVKALT